MEQFDFSKIDLVDLLERHGITPVYNRGDSFWYNSPFREDKTPSFQVRGNLFTDWGDLDFKGGVIALCKKLWNIPDGQERLVFHQLNEIYGNGYIPSVEHQKRMKDFEENSNREARVIANYPLNNDALLAYLERRGVDNDVAKKYCRVLVFQNKERTKKLYGIGFQNQKGGYELRNEFMKISFAPKAISVIGNGGNDNAVIFEGFIDALSYLSEMKRMGRPITFDVFVLNGVNQVDQAIEQLKNYSHVYGLVDTDKPGDDCTQKMASALPHFIDSRSWLGEYNDVNEKVMALHKLPQMGKKIVAQHRKHKIG